MSKIIIVLLIFISFYGQAQVDNTEGHLEDHNNIIFYTDDIKYDSAIIVFVSAHNSDVEIYDTALIQDGVLKYSFHPQELHRGIIIPFSLFYKFENGMKKVLPSSRITFYIVEGDTVKINAQISEQIAMYTSGGNTLSYQLSEYVNTMNDVFQHRLQFERSYNKKNPSSWTKEEEDSYWNQRKENDKLYNEKSIEFILAHPDYEYSARLLLSIKDKDKFKELHKLLGSNVKESYYGKIVQNMINGWSITSPGTEIPDIDLTTLSGEKLSLHDFKGKYVLLDFWGSWCSPCLAEIPDIKRLNATYKDKMVTIGLICNDSKEKVLNTIQKHNIDWLQVFSDNNEYPEKFGLSVFPTKILIDDKGVVVNTYLGSSDKIIKEIEDILK